MAFERSCFFLFFFLLAVVLASSSPSTHISYDALKVQMLGGRGLLERFYVKNNCPVDFAKENFSPITNICKGPYYNPLACCNGFTQVSCKYAELLNHVENGCSYGLFYFMNKQGGYPVNLFNQICHGDEEGLSCEKPRARSNGNRGRH